MSSPSNMPPFGNGNVGANPMEDYAFPDKLTGHMANTMLLGNITIGMENRLLISNISCAGNPAWIPVTAQQDAQGRPIGNFYPAPAWPTIPSSGDPYRIDPTTIGRGGLEQTVVANTPVRKRWRYNG